MMSVCRIGAKLPLVSLRRLTVRKRHTFSSFLKEEIQRFETNLPLEESRTAPASWYTNKEFHSLEAESVFKNNWLHIGHIGELAEKGAYFTGCLIQRPYVVLKDMKVAEDRVCLVSEALTGKGDG